MEPDYEDFKRMTPDEMNTHWREKEAEQTRLAWTIGLMTALAWLVAIAVTLGEYFSRR